MSSSRIFLSPPDVTDRERDLLVAAFDSGWVAPVGPDIGAFEEELSGLADGVSVAALSSGTAALHLALAAYNVGWGHLGDARTLALRMGKDPNSWHDVRSTLPLLRQKKYYRTLQYGYARGTEPVRYVENIRTYYEILKRKL